MASRSNSGSGGGSSSSSNISSGTKGYALDASAFYSGMPFLFSSSQPAAGETARCYTTQAVFDEISHIKSSHAAIDALIDSGKLEVVAGADSASTRKVVAAAKKTGDYARLSSADISILALAAERSLHLVSDDYAVANVASALGIKAISSTGKGIRETRKWTSYCSACGRAFGPDAARRNECPLCGNRLSRKYRAAAAAKKR